MSDIAISFAILVAVVVAVRLRTGCPVGRRRASAPRWRCGRPGVLTLEQALAGFGDPTVLFIARLFVVSEGLDATGVTAWAGQQLIDRAGDEPQRGSCC